MLFRDVDTYPDHETIRRVSQPRPRTCLGKTNLVNRPKKGRSKGDEVTWLAPIRKAEKCCFEGQSPFAVEGDLFVEGRSIGANPAVCFGVHEGDKLRTAGAWKLSEAYVATSLAGPFGLDCRAFSPSVMRKAVRRGGSGSRPRIQRVGNACEARGAEVGLQSEIRRTGDSTLLAGSCSFSL